MTKLRKKNSAVTLTVVALIMLAYSCRIIGNMGYFTKEAGLLRSFLYIGLYLAWCFSIRTRIIQTQVRWYLTTIAALMVFWFVVRTLKFHFISGILYPNVVRYLWYSYYLPMLFIPLLAVFVSMSIRQPETYRLPKRATLLYVPTILLFLLVITNDLHQLVFTFPADAVVWRDSENGYAIGYYLVVGWLILCALLTLGQMYGKCRIPGRRKRILLPCLPICFLLIYLALYNLQVEWLRIIAGDITAIICLMYALTLESCIHCGFIQANTDYGELFDAATVGVQITDDAYQVCLSSQAAKSFEPKLLCQTESAPVLLQDGTRLSGAPIHGGHVIWTEDISALMEVLEELKETKENLEDSNGILEEENALKAREAHLAEQDRLYQIIQHDTAPQIRLMDELIRQVEEADTEREQILLLKKMLVIGAYLKRRSNLIFLADKMSRLDKRELTLTFLESIDNLEMYGVTCGFFLGITRSILAVHLISMYDFFEEIVEHSLDSMTSLTVSVKEINHGICMTINTDSSADFSHLLTKTAAARQDEDGEWQLTLQLTTEDGDTKNAGGDDI